MRKSAIQPSNNSHHCNAVDSLNFEKDFKPDERVESLTGETWSQEQEIFILAEQ
jgi:hypothetical protein